MLSKTVHLRPLRSSHIIRVKSPERAARICDRNSIIESDFEYKPILKTSFDSKIYKFQKDRMSNPPNINDTKQYHTEGSHINDTDSAICHTVDYFVQKKKRYNQQVKDVQNVPLSRVVSQEEFKALRSTSNGLSHSPPPKRGEEADQRNIYRRNFYVSKPFAQINKDFKSLVPNAQTTSEDTPHWFQGTTQYYDQDNLDQAKKLRKSQSGVSQTDIFGKPNVKPSQADYPFFAQPPSKGQRYELNRMVIAERRTEKDYDSRVPHVQLKWEEKPQNQSYDRVKMTNKIGKNGQPFIKDLEAKRAFDPMITYKKIGEFQEAQRIKQEKPMELKIGHPNDQYIHAKRKAREDGFYGNRKEIAGENYQRSSFFV